MGDKSNEGLDELLKELSAEINNNGGDLLDPQEIDKTRQDLEKYQLSSFPTTMSCVQAFDELVDCYSIGGQVRHVYRYGHMNNCLDKRNKVKFCLVTKLAGADEQKKRIATYYMEKLAKQKLERGSSEDVWKPRTEPVHRPFSEN
jgi:hypothetical protein